MMTERGQIALLLATLVSLAASAHAQESAPPPQSPAAPAAEGEEAPPPPDDQRQDDGAPASDALEGDEEEPDGTEPPTAHAEQPAGDAPTDAEEDLEAELAEELALIEAERAGESPDSGATDTGTATTSARGLSNLMNPAVSANGLILVGYTTRPEHEEATDEEHAHGREDLTSGLHLQEVELRISAVVDPYFRADLTLSAHEDELAFEEAFITTLEIPRVAIRAGQMYANLGRHNLLHTHAFPFLTAPLPWRALLGADGLKDVGVSADVLLPLPFFTEINAQVFRGEWRPFAGEIPDDPMTVADESVPDRRRDRDLAYLAHLKTLFELGASSTVELGGTYIGGRNGFARWGHVVGADLTFKWRPVEAERYQGFEWTTEYLWVDRPGAPEERRQGGAYSAVRYQFHQRWWAQVLGSVLGVPAGDEGRTWRAEALVAFVPSEFSALRLSYALEALESGAERAVHEIYLQAIFSVGSHPSHAY